MARLLLLLCAGLLGLGFGAHPLLCAQHSREYAVFVDAGSSGSRLHVYSFYRPPRLPHWLQQWLPSSNALPNIDIVATATTVPGLSSLSSVAEANVGEYLSPLLSVALDTIPADKQSSTPFYLFATAGLRLIPRALADNILMSVCHTVRLSTPFNVSGGCESHCRIISGEDEALYGWLAVNYLHGGFDRLDKQSPRPPTSTSPSTFGFLDMGGASTQFAFEPEPELQAQYATDLLNVSLKTVSGSTREFRVFVSSFLGFGVNEARRRYIQGLAEDFGFFPTGGEITLDRDEPEIHLHHHESLTLSRNEENLIHTVPDPCLPKNLIVESDKYLAETPLPHPLRIRGTGSLSKCLIDLRPYLRKQLPCAKEPCLFDGVFAPISDFSKHRFIGVSEYYYTPVAISGHFTQPADDGKSFHFRKFVENAEKLCSRTYNSLYSAHALKHGVIVEGSEEEARLQLQCFKSAWVLEILHEGIGILDGNDDPPQDATISLQYGDKEQVQRVTSFEPLNEVDGYKISWTLGAMIMHTAKQL